MTSNDVSRCRYAGSSERVHSLALGLSSWSLTTRSAEKVCGQLPSDVSISVGEANGITGFFKDVRGGNRCLVDA
jgi:hypothetical protein